jgi:hypothetical protein
MSLKERVGRLERARGAGGCQIISIRGGFGDDLETASADGLTLRRQPGEERPAFVERVRTAARAAGVRGFIVIGGFNDG